MPRRGKRTRIARNIYQDKSGVSAVVNVGEWHRERRFPHGTPISVMRQWIEDTQRRLRGCGRARPKRGTLAADIDEYLALVRHLAGWVSLRSELRHWAAELGPVNRYTIADVDVLRVRNRWLAGGVAPKTCNHRVNALKRLWHRLDGKHAETPADSVAPLQVHKTPPVVIPNALVDRVYAKLLEMEHQGVLRDAKTRARFMVMASTGKRPSEVMRAQPGDVDLTRRVWVVRDGKGGFSPGLYLNNDMLAAWQTFVAAEAWGTFREGALVDTLKSAGWPCVTDKRGHVRASPRPYELRHTVGILMSESGADLADIQQHMGHKRIETTRRHYVPVLNSRLQKLSESLSGRFAWRDAAPDGTSDTATARPADGDSLCDAPESSPPPRNQGNE